MNNTDSVSRKEYEALQKQIATLVRTSGNHDLMLVPEEERGTSFLVSFYKSTAKDKPRLVIGWATLADEVFPKAGGGIEEDQRVRVFLEPGEDDKSIESLEARLEKTKDKEKRDATIKEIEELKGKNQKDMTLRDFGLKNIIKERVTIKGTETRGKKVNIIFDWDGKEKRLGIQFVN
jgi:hypothetical protein